MIFIALSPILWLIVALTVLHMSAWKTCSIALLIAWGAGLGLYGMTPAHAAEAALEGAALACWPILLVIIAAIFTYNLSLHTKSMDTIKQMLTSVSSDMRVLILLIGWGFGSFLEGMAGFGTAVAIPAGMLAGLGVPPLLAASVCLIANSVPTTCGSIGIPVVTLSNITGFPDTQLALYSTLQLAPISLLCPFLMTIVAGGSLKALKGMIPCCLAAGFGFILPEIAVAAFLGPDLSVIAGSIGAMGAIVLCTRLLPQTGDTYALPAHEEAPAIDMHTALLAWLPFILIFVFLLVTSKLIPALHDPLSLIRTSVLIYDGAGGTPYTFTWVATPGVLILLAAFLGGHLQGAGLKEMLAVLERTVVDLRFTIITIITIIATAKVMGYAGMTLDIASTAVAATGTGYPLIAAFIGSIGTFITGSATSSCVLFGKLQTGAATAIGASSAGQAWLAAANPTGACAGKMISPQNIAIAIGAIGAKGCDGKLLSFAVKVYIPFVLLMGAIVYIGFSLL